MPYNWEHTEWPEFTYNISDSERGLLEFGIKTGGIAGLIKGLPEDVKIDAIISMMVSEAIKSSEIEGEFLSRKDVVSSIKMGLGISVPQENIADQHAKGISELIVAMRKSFREPLSEMMLFEWHTMLMRGNSRINKGQWRAHSEPMRVVSGTVGKESVHFEAPPSDRVNKEMKQYIQWFNDTDAGQKYFIQNPIIRSAIAHVYFESIHPFEDGNGRIGRVLSEKILSQGLGQPIVISLSKTIEKNKKAYYQALKQAQRTLDLTEWINYFVDVVLDALRDAERQINFSLQKTKFFDNHGAVLNERQLKVIQRMLREGPDGFEGGMSAKKYMSITKTSKATATRDLQFLTDHGIFSRSGGGRNTGYTLILN